MKKHPDYYRLLKPKSNWRKFILIIRISSFILVCCASNIFAAPNSYKTTNNSLNLKDEIINTLSDQSQQKSVSGKVTDSSGASLPGVSVVVKGTTKGVITDTNGKYSLTNIRSDATLVYSFVGMKRQEIAVGDKTVVNASMVEDALGIDEVVVVGYGTQKKVNLTGAVAVASKEIFESKSVPNSIAALQGALPGVTISRTSGKPGSEGYDLQIRGLLQ